MKVMIVEDQTMIRSLLESYFRAEDGYRITASIPGAKQAVEMCNIKKTFGKVVANNNVSLSLRKGEILALLGENGSGKSTLSNIIAGIYEQSSGQMFFQNEPYCPKSVLDSSRKGISLLAQETGTIAGMTVCENMFLGEETQNSRWGLVNFRRLCQSTAEILKRHGLALSLRR